ncbi:MAG: hypothetical protein JO291_15820 [Acidimicrobiia bacterium]|nr:hypothetical protein [Acidimicrobiia bacterium]
MTIDLRGARTFIEANARVLDQRVARCLFDGDDPATVADAVTAYRNADGGFGHGLEPDKRAPGSQPLDVEIAFEALAAVGAPALDLVASACDYLDTVADADGAVPIAFPEIADHPHAVHWNEIPLEPALNPTASILAYALALGTEHRWVTRATEWCFRTLEQDGPPDEVHALRCVAWFLDAAPDRDRAQALGPSVGAALPGANLYQAEPDPDEYGVGPLEFAPTPASLARAWFDDAQIERHLDHLEHEQRPDGGWPIAWEPPSDASRCDWRGMVTIHALRTLRAYGRLPD